MEHSVPVLCKAEVHIWSEHETSAAVDELAVSKKLSSICRLQQQNINNKIKLLITKHELLQFINMNKKKPQNLTPMLLDRGQSLQALQASHNISLPVSIWTLNSLGGDPSFTLVKYSLNKKPKITSTNQNIKTHYHTHNSLSLTQNTELIFTAKKVTIFKLKINAGARKKSIKKETLKNPEGYNWNYPYPMA